MSRSYATDCREPCQGRNTAALSGFVPCDIRLLCRSYLYGFRFGGKSQGKMHGFLKIKGTLSPFFYFNFSLKKKNSAVLRNFFVILTL